MRENKDNNSIRMRVRQVRNIESNVIIIIVYVKNHVHNNKY